MYMYSRNIFLILIVISISVCTSVTADDKQTVTHSGTALTQNEIKQWSITVYPSGQGLPDGKGTAQEGAELYNVQCLGCHGSGGDGGVATRFIGLQGYPTGSKDPLRALSVGAWPNAVSIFDFTRRAMPHYSPKSLTDSQVYALTAYILFLNGIIDNSLSIDKVSLPKVEMPNSKNVINVWQSEQVK